MICLGKNSFEKLHAFVPYCSTLYIIQLAEASQIYEKMELSVKKTKFLHFVIRNQIRRLPGFLSNMNFEAPRPKGRGFPAR
jgi:hypothetical protein